MAQHNADIVIFGAGIAGLWTFNHLKSLGYDVLLLESKAIGSGQTIASQGIVHSGLKYAFAGKVNKLAQSISAMPDLWRAALKGQGPVDLSAARMSAETQYLLVPSGLMGGLVKLVTKKVLGGSVREIEKKDWPTDVVESGFKGAVIYMDEPVLDTASVIRALAEPYKDSVRLVDTPDDPLVFLEQHNISAKKIIFTAARSNHETAKKLGHDAGLETQARPLLMGLLKPAPFEMYAHLVGNSDKPVATITTHKCADGTLAWYLGGGVAERVKESSIDEVIEVTKKGFAKYLPQVDLSEVQWGAWPIDRIEGKSEVDGWMPDTPTIHSAENCIYCWPTKLTFAPMLSERLIKKLKEDGVEPSDKQTDWSFLPEAPYTQNPWDVVQWTKDSSDRQESQSRRSVSGQ